MTAAALLIINADDASRVDNWSLMSCLRLDHEIVFKLDDVVHWIPWTQAESHTNI